MLLVNALLLATVSW